MPLVTDRTQVLETLAEAAERKWVLPAFNTENQTTTEAILAAGQDFALRREKPDLPVCIGITNCYGHRSQSANYTHTRRWDVGLAFFLGNLEALTGPGGPFEALRVLVHLDHIQWDTDEPFLAEWDPGRYASIMFDASTLPFEENVERTAAFVEKYHGDLVIEGACDEIREASESGPGDLTTPEMAERFIRGTGADLIVANLGTEHRASAAQLEYRGDRAREIAARVGPRLCLHGTSSVAPERVKKLFADGVRKVNLWTCLERDSTPALLRDMVRHASALVGPEAAVALAEEGLLGPAAGLTEARSLAYYTTTYRQEMVFNEMKRIVTGFLDLWYV